MTAPKQAQQKLDPGHDPRSNVGHCLVPCSPNAHCADCLLSRACNMCSKPGFLFSSMYTLSLPRRACQRSYLVLVPALATAPWHLRLLCMTACRAMSMPLLNTFRTKIGNHSQIGKMSNSRMLHTAQVNFQVTVHVMCLIK